MKEKTAERLDKEKTVTIKKDKLFLNAHGRNCIIRSTAIQLHMYN